MKLLPRRRAEDDASTTEDASVERPAGAKGRPTPKRRDAEPRRTPITAPPQNRREAMRWQREQTKAARTAQSARKPSSGAKATPTRGGTEYRDALRRGEEEVLPKRDKGPVRRLARDWVDSRRMLSNYMLYLMLPIVVGMFSPKSAIFGYLNIVTLVFFIAIVVEWYLGGRKILTLARERGLETKETPIGLGFYAGSRAYMPRRWRIPNPNVELGAKL